MAVTPWRRKFTARGAALKTAMLFIAEVSSMSFRPGNQPFRGFAPVYTWPIWIVSGLLMPIGVKGVAVAGGILATPSRAASVSSAERSRSSLRVTTALPTV